MLRTITYGLLLAAAGLLLTECQAPDPLEASWYDCNTNFSDSSAYHPKADLYRAILESNRPNGAVGAVLLVEDRHGRWMGADGLADIHRNVPMDVCLRFCIGGISKIFTATAILSLVDDDRLSLDDPLNEWVDSELIDKVANANEVTIWHLLAHTSGIPDYYTDQFDLDRYNKVDNDFKYEEVLSYIYNRSATNAPGESYYYSNTNYLLLGMVAEAVTGQRLEKIYKDRIFNVINLESGWYSYSDPIPRLTPQGYIDLHGTGQFVDSKFLFLDEMYSASTGIVMDAFDLARFMDGLFGERFVSLERLQEMTDWSDLPANWIDEVTGHERNGLGLEYFNTPHGYAVGHKGHVDGFSSILYYFPEEEATLRVFPK